MTRTDTHTPGPGLVIVGKEQWYGPGYCGICGDRSEELVPQAVRYWHPDDGWRMGVLCQYCGEEAAARGPRPDDYAVATRRKKDPEAKALEIDVNASLGDMDSTYSTS